MSLKNIHLPATMNTSSDDTDVDFYMPALSLDTSESLQNDQEINQHHVTTLFLEVEEQTEIEPPPDIIELLFKDVAKVPIITSPHQELWLGIQLKAVQRWRSFSKDNLLKIDNETTCLSICTTLIEKHQELETLCLTHDVQPPKIETWISELLSARRNIYELKQSRLRRFIRRTRQQADEAAGKHFLELAGTIGEMFSWLPNALLAQMIDFIQEYDYLPSANKMSAWIMNITTPQLLDKQIERQAKKAVQTLVTGYLRYVMRVAQGHLGKGVDYADLVQEGFLGLMRAAEKFEYQKQIRFGAYATNWIWQKVGRAIADQAKTIRIPVHKQEQLRKFEQVCALFDTGNKECVTNSVILFRAELLDEKYFKQLQRAEKARKPPPKPVQEQYEKAVQKAKILEFVQTPSLPLDSLRPQFEAQTGDDIFDDRETILETIPDTKTTLPEITVDKRIVHHIIEQKILTRLTSRQKQVLELRYGINDGKERTLEEVGEFFDLTRERIRQIEVQTFKYLKHGSVKKMFPRLHDLLSDDTLFSDINDRLPYYSTKTEDIFERNINEEYIWLNALLDNLPRSNWHKGRHIEQRGDTREEQVSDALNSLSTPAHYSDITEQVNEEITGKPLDERHVQSILAQNESSFILLGQSVFSLVKWEKKRAGQDTPILPFCPVPLPDPPDYENAFFESVLVGSEQLLNGITAVKFLNQMLHWAQADTNQQKWFLQSILSAYYLTGLIPYIFHFDGNNPVLTCTLPDLSIQELRYYCLQTLTERLVAMPEFWWLLQKEQPTRPSTLGDEFADIHPDGLDDVLPRLRMLAGLGAAQKLKYGRYRLTSIGEKCANRWKKQPELTIDILPKKDAEDHLMDFAIW